MTNAFFSQLAVMVLLQFVWIDVYGDASTRYLPKKLTLATVNTFEPYAFSSGDTVVRGIDFELTKEIFRRIGIEVQLYSYPRKRVILMLEKGSIDGIATSTPYFEVDNLFKSV